MFALYFSSVCASQITSYIHDSDIWSCDYFYRWKITEGFLNSARKKPLEEHFVMVNFASYIAGIIINLFLKMEFSHQEYYRKGLIVDKFKADELQSVIMTLGEPNLDGDISANFHLVDFYPACNTCGIRRLTRENCERCDCFDVVYCSKSCLEADSEQHKIICPSSQ